MALNSLFASMRSQASRIGVSGAEFVELAHLAVAKCLEGFDPAVLAEHVGGIENVGQLVFAQFVDVARNEHIDLSRYDGAQIWVLNDVLN